LQQQSQPRDGDGATAAGLAGQLAGCVAVVRCDPSSGDALNALRRTYEAAQPGDGDCHAAAAEGVGLLL